jgi:hypothetical protein
MLPLDPRHPDTLQRLLHTSNSIQTRSLVLLQQAIKACIPPKAVMVEAKLLSSNSSKGFLPKLSSMRTLLRALLFHLLPQHQPPVPTSVVANGMMIATSAILDGNDITRNHMPCAFSLMPRSSHDEYALMIDLIMGS